MQGEFNENWIDTLILSPYSLEVKNKTREGFQEYLIISFTASLTASWSEFLVEYPDNTWDELCWIRLNSLFQVRQTWAQRQEVWRSRYEKTWETISGMSKGKAIPQLKTKTKNKKQKLIKTSKYLYIYRDSFYYIS